MATNDLAAGVNDARTKLSQAMGRVIDAVADEAPLSKGNDRPERDVTSVAVYDPEERRRLPGVLRLDEMRFTPSDHIWVSQDRDSGRPEIHPVLLIQNVKLFCSTCDETQVFACVWSVDVTNEVEKADRDKRRRSWPCR